MSVQIFELARMHGVHVMGVAMTEDHRVRTAYIDAPLPGIDGYGDGEVPGQLRAREVIALGQVLVQFGEAMLAGTLRHDANKGGGS
jgi:hypothetical protein